MGRPEERIFRTNDEISALRWDEYLASEELIMLNHLDGDAQSDAVVGGSPLGTQDARESARDVARMQRHVADLRAAREHLERKRDRMLEKLNVSATE